MQTTWTWSLIGGTKTPHATGWAKKQNKKKHYFKMEIIQHIQHPISSPPAYFFLPWSFTPVDPSIADTSIFLCPQCGLGWLQHFQWWDYSGSQMQEAKLKMAITAREYALRLAELKPWSMIKGKRQLALNANFRFSLDKWQRDTLLLPQLYWGISDKKCTYLSCVHRNHCLN